MVKNAKTISHRIVEALKKEPKSEKEILDEIKISPKNVSKTLNMLARRRILFRNELSGKFNITSIGRDYIGDNSISDSLSNRLSE